MKRDKIPINNQQAPSGASSCQAALTLDYARYEKYLEDSNLTNEQKKEFLDTLWSIIVSFVDLGYEIHPVQQVVSEPCGQNDEIDALITSASDFVLGSKNTSNNQSKQTKDRPPDASKTRIQP